MTMILLQIRLRSAWGLAKKYTGIPKIVVEKEGTRAALTYKDGKLSGTYTLKATIDPSIAGKAHKAKKVTIKGLVESDERQLKLQGAVDTSPFLMQIGLDPYVLLNFSYAQDAAKNAQGIVLENKNGLLQGTIDFEYIKEALVHFFGFQPQGTGRVSVKANMQRSPLSVDIAMNNGTIKIPEAHNFIKEAQASVSFDLHGAALL